MSPIIVAIDSSAPTEVKSLIDALDPKLCRLKVGKELYTALGPKIVETMQHKGFEVFLDLKFHDIPNTTAGAVKVAAQMGVWMVNVHALGGLKMMVAAREILSDFSHPPILIGVTLLTSMSTEMANEVGLQGDKDQIVERLTELVFKAGLDGVVCSADESKKIVNRYNFLTVCPGIRLETPLNNDDQTRIMTPEAALKEQASYLVIGRPITQALDPACALEAILARIA